jgi:putative endopeptidase
LGTNEDAVAEVVVRQPDFLTAFAALWAERDIEDWKRWLRWRVINARASLLTDEVVEENFDFYGRTMSGTEQIRDRWKRGVGLVEGLLGDAVGKLYVERHFPPGAKARMDELVENPRGLPGQHQRPGVDDARDAAARAGQARQVHPEDRLPGAVAGLLGADHRPK